MKFFKSVLLCFGVAVTTALAGGTSPEAVESERGASDPPRGFASDAFEPNNNMLSGAQLFSFTRKNVIVGRARLTPGDVDYWEVALVANQTLVVVTTPLSGLPQGFATPDTTVSIRNAADVSQVLDDNGGADFPSSGIRGSIVRFQAAVAGNYFVRVEGVGGDETGEYAIHFATVAYSIGTAINDTDWSETSNDTPANADVVPIREIGPSLGKADTESTTLDYYRVDLSFGDILIACANQISNLPTNWNTPDLRMRILGPDGVTALLTTSSDTAGELPASSTSGVTARFRAPARGTYYVFVDQNVVDSTLFYTIFMAVIPAADCPGDSDGSGVVNFADITNVLINFGNSCP